MLTFVYGTMAAGKSTVALQMAHSLQLVGGTVALWTAGDRSESGLVTSRIGVSAEAVPVSAWSSAEIEKAAAQLSADALAADTGVAHLLIDEAQFLDPEIVDTVGRVTDDHHLDVVCFGLRVDFRGELFPGTRRLFEVADRIEALPVPARCWCGAPGMHNARVNGQGVVLREGPQVMIGDVTAASDNEQLSMMEDAVRYVILCRAHWREGRSAR
ncbi:MAG: thymidine kinase [Acidimicrobiia bacterium]